MAAVIFKNASLITSEIVLSKTCMTIGRLRSNDIVIDDPTVSGHHARILIENGRFMLRDLNSLNGTFVNGHPARNAAIKYGDEIQIGKSTLLLKNSGTQPLKLTEITQNIQSSAEDIGPLLHKTWSRL
jgi:pSer/pThr/pTyr-binding forkhead associated (FHA) protein